MAGEWIKMELCTPDKPEVLKVARLLSMDPDTIVGKLFRLWAWVDQISVDGVVDGVVDADVDRVVFCDGFAASLVRVGWLEVDNENEQVRIPNFGHHNGESAKSRALKTKRQAKWRAKNVDAKPSTPTSTREEKRREDIYRGKFQKPTVEECGEYFTEKGFSESEAVRFWNFYESKGWYVGKNKMKKWKNAAANWLSDKTPTATSREVAL